MARARKRHVQQSIEFRTWGGKRRGAGRPKRGFRASEPHKKRPALSARASAHVILRVEKDIESLRKGRCYRAFRAAMITAYRFADRYHARILRTPTEVRHAINYVLNNWRHHDEDDGFESKSWDVDYFSSGPTFTGWRDPIPPLPSSYMPLQTSKPKTWLLNIGWTRAGEISMYSRPGRGCHEG